MSGATPHRPSNSLTGATQDSVTSTRDTLRLDLTGKETLDAPTLEHYLKADRLSAASVEQHRERLANDYMVKNAVRGLKNILSRSALDSTSRQTQKEEALEKKMYPHLVRSTPLA